MSHLDRSLFSHSLDSPPPVAVVDGVRIRSVNAALSVSGMGILPPVLWSKQTRTVSHVAARVPVLRDQASCSAEKLEGPSGGATEVVRVRMTRESGWVTADWERRGLMG
jgi:hypothetical protein